MTQNIEISVALSPELRFEKALKQATTSCIQFLSYKSEYGREIIEKTDYDLRTTLIPFLPENALDEVVAMLQKYYFHLHITPPCYKYKWWNKEDFKNYRGWINYSPNCSDPHKIYIRNNLDKDTFLEVFLHEYAHLLTRLSFSNPSWHYNEFHFCFCKLIHEFFKKKIISEYDTYFDFKGSFKIRKDFYMYKELPDWTMDEYHKYILALVSNHIFLKTIRIGSQFEYKGEIFVRGKGKQEKICCTRLSDSKIFPLEPDTPVIPALDLCW